MKTIHSAGALAMVEATAMPPRSQALQGEPDRHFLLWVLAGLIVATIGAGAAAMIIALTTSDISLFSWLRDIRMRQIPRNDGGEYRALNYIATVLLLSVAAFAFGVLVGSMIS